MAVIKYEAYSELAEKARRCSGRLSNNPGQRLTLTHYFTHCTNTWTDR
jgi:hypothetical protein